MNDIRVEYKNWLLHIASEWMNQYGSYQKLLEYLVSREFYAKIPNDKNREADGKDLRFKFIEQSNDCYTYRDVYLYLDFPVSVLEVIVALAIRVEDHIMGDLDSEDRTYYWFHSMIENLELIDMDDYSFDLDFVENAIDNFLNRAYCPNGRGGLFTVNNASMDMRKAEIWFQLCWYLEELNNK